MVNYANSIYSSIGNRIMNIGKIVFPHLQKQARRNPGSIKKGLVNSLPVTQSIRTPKLQQIISKLEGLKGECASIDQPIRLLRYISEKYRGYEAKETQINYLNTRALKAEQKVSEIKAKLKKAEIKYTKDISEIIKLKILSESTGMSRSNLLLSCNHVEIVRKIENILQKEIKTFDLTEPSLCSEKGEDEDKQNDSNYSDLNHKQELTALKSQIIGLQQELSKLRSPSKSPLSSNHRLDRSSLKQNTRHVSVVIPSPQRNSETKSKRSSVGSKNHAHEQEIKQLKQEIQSHIDSTNNYKQECFRKQQEQVFLNKILLSYQINTTDSE